MGADWAVLGGRLSGTVDAYRKDTEDLIFDVPVDPASNLSNVVTTNIGAVRNTGVELSLNAGVLDRGDRGLRWDVNFNAAHNRNRLVRVNGLGGGAEQILVGPITGGQGNHIQVLQPGVAAYSFLVYRHRRGEDGKPIFADTNGDGTISESDLYEDLNEDGAINLADRAPFQSPNPTWILGHTSTLGWRAFDMSFTLRANLGGYVYNNNASNRGYYNNLQGIAPTNLDASVLDYGFVTPQYFSDVYVEDASYLRMDNISVGYAVPRPRGMQSMRVFGTVQNVFTVTAYSGIDPMAGVNGIDNNIYPRARTFSIGATLGF